MAFGKQKQEEKKSVDAYRAAELARRNTPKQESIQKVVPPLKGSICNTDSPLKE